MQRREQGQRETDETERRTLGGKRREGERGAETGRDFKGDFEEVGTDQGKAEVGRLTLEGRRGNTVIRVILSRITESLRGGDGENLSPGEP